MGFENDQEVSSILICFKHSFIFLKLLRILGIPVPLPSVSLSSLRNVNGKMPKVVQIKLPLTDQDAWLVSEVPHDLNERKNCG